MTYRKCDICCAGYDSFGAGQWGSVTKKLSELITNVKVINPDRMPPATEIKALTADSREAGAGALFVAVPGFSVDGHDYVEGAAQKGCAAVVVEKGRCGSFQLPAETVCLEVEDCRVALGQIAASFWDHPADKLIMIGITGTNGKTTSAYLLEAIIRHAGGNPGVIGTVNYRYNGLELPAPHTTPEPIALQRLLRRMADAGVTHVVMEVSSHALAQKRMNGVLFDVALFTNLSRDHLDFHGDMEHYFSCKKLLFADYLKPKASAVIMLHAGQYTGEDDVLPGDAWGERLAGDLRSMGQWRQTSGQGREILTCGGRGNSLAVIDFQETLAGMAAEIETPAGTMTLHSPLVGEFNLRNLLGVIGAGLALKIDPQVISRALAVTGAAPGRLEPVKAAGGLKVFVDYAHTPDALENVLKTLRKLVAGRLIVVFGCGGDRDRGKRPQMGEAAGRLADVIAVTSDNPRSELPEAILADIETGLASSGLPRMRMETLLQGRKLQGYDLIISRREAIRTVIRHARPDDVIIISGKGHETYQQTRAGRFYFDDRVFVKQELAVVKW